ncbi:MAG: DUF5615 family PIN-like protein, partial [Chloroflexi bacterium]|nr:DUF5615 family PIN-like protein [Chloroflexota bacterium]
MSLRLYLDECAYNKRLRDLLRQNPFRHYVETAADANLLGRPDEEHLLYAHRNGLLLVTKNPADFEALHHRQPDHSGILAIYQDNRPGDLSALDIARAIENL